MTLSRFRIGTRLAAAFLVVLALMLAIAGTAWRALSLAEDHLHEIVGVNIRKAGLLSTMADQVHDKSRHLRDILLLQNARDREGLMEKVAEAHKKYDEAVEALRKMPLDEEERGLLSRLEAAAREAEAVNNRAFEHARAGEDAQARRLLLGEGAPKVKAWLDAIQDALAVEREHNEKEYAAVQRDAWQAEMLLLAIAAVAMIASALAGWTITRSIIQPLVQARQLAASVADGDLTLQVHAAGRDECAELLQALQRMRDQLARVVGEVRQNAESVASASAQISQGNTDLSSRTEEQASALQQTAASMKQLTATVQENADSASRANELAVGASGVATRGGEVVGEVVQTMRGIHDSSRRIGDIIGTIDGIAFQTNILALNAAVEAARAGEQGRGFAVVAAEVRTLAQRSADAAREIKELITASVGQVEQGTALVNRAGETMGDVVAAIRQVTEIIGRINTASNEQSAAVGQVGQAVGQMDQTTQQNAALVEESAAAAQSLKTQAQHLVQAVAVFRTRAAAMPA